MNKHDLEELYRATEDDLLTAYPNLRPEHVRAAQAYAAAALASEETVFLTERPG